MSKLTIPALADMPREQKLISRANYMIVLSLIHADWAGDQTRDCGSMHQHTIRSLLNLNLIHELKP